ncbi:helix-turn-helix domain-containing protein [Inquilinus sp. OTU3971]|uniref:helix-turn-helix domain-containing protein n=1 Tax=Inquilinus sp. OTU3971 TaxID=3043855 RepID=UPI00313D6C17
MTKHKGKAVDLADELVASLEQAVAIVKGDMAPGRVHEPIAVPDVDVRAARRRLGMSQPAFAAAFGVALPTLRKWEQRVRRPEGPARVLLRVIEREPDAVRRALAGDRTFDSQT